MSEMAGRDRRGDAVLRAFARDLAKMRRDLRNLEAANQLSSSSIEGGTLDVYDDDDVLRERIGKQANGSYGRLVLEGPVPPIPSEPDVQVIADGVVAITWDGRCEEKWPFVEFRNVRIHLVEDPVNEVCDRDNQVGAIFAHRGGTILAVTESDDDNPVYARLVAVSSAGHVSDPSPAVLVDELDENDLEEDQEELAWEDRDGHTLTQADIDAGIVTFGLSHDPEAHSVLAWWHPGGLAYSGVPQDPTQFSVDYTAPAVTWPLSGFEQVDDRLRVYYPYQEGHGTEVQVIDTTSAKLDVAGTSLVVPISAATEPGDLLLLCAGRAVDLTVSSGWIHVATQRGLRLYSRTADGTETGVTITAGSDLHAGIVVTLRGGTQVDISTGEEDPAGPTFASPGVDVGHQISFAAFDGDNSVGAETIASVDGTVLKNLAMGTIWGLAAADGDATFTASQTGGYVFWAGISAGVS